MIDHQAQTVFIPVAEIPGGLEGNLDFPEEVRGLVIFAHGSGSSRLSPRNRLVARRLRDSGIATLLFDLLSEEEAADRTNVFDIGLLADRMEAAIDWASAHPATRTLPIGLFGASTGAAAALVAAARRPEAVKAIVSRGGRPDLAGESLKRVGAATLLIVGGEDHEVIALNQAALALLNCEKAIEIVPGATHLFEEPGTLESVMELAADWFSAHLNSRA